MPEQRGASRAEIVGEGWIEVGRVVRVCGLEGALAVALDAGHPVDLAPPQRICLAGPPGRIPFRIEAARALGGAGSSRIELRLAGVSSRERAEPWVGSRVLVPPEALRATGPAGRWPAGGQPSEARRRELLGLTVRLPDGSAVGTVDEIWPSPAHHLLVIHRKKGDPLLIPAVPPILARVDLAARELWIDPPAGLIPEETR
jgi:16S rRNA processing protein RimM